MKFNEQSLAVLCHTGGWVGQFTLSDDQLKQLRLCIKHPVLDEAVLVPGLTRTFEATCYSELARQTDQKLTTIARRAKKKFLDALRVIDVAFQTEPFAVAIDAEYDGLRRDNPKAPGLSKLQEELGRRLDLFRCLAQRAEFEVTTGGNAPSFCQMVRGLAELYELATGREGTRTYVQAMREGQTAGDDGELLRLAQLMAEFVADAVGQELEKRLVSPKLRGKRGLRLTKLVRSEIRARREAQGRLEKPISKKRP
jgi:hypothetical protein